MSLTARALFCPMIICHGRDLLSRYAFGRCVEGDRRRHRRCRRRRCRDRRLDFPKCGKLSEGFKSQSGLFQVRIYQILDSRVVFVLLKIT